MLASSSQDDSSLTRTSIRKLRVAELRDELTKRGIDSSGIREVLLGRMLEAVFGSTSDSSEKDAVEEQPPKFALDHLYIEKEPPKFSLDRLYVLRFRGHTVTSYSNAGVGLVIYDVEAEKEVWHGRRYFPEEQSRFEAEYKGIMIGLNVAYMNGIRRLVLQGDNHVILNQLQGSFNVKKETLRKLYWTTIELKEKFDLFEVQPINVAENSRAKTLASRAVASKKSFGLEGQDNLKPAPGEDQVGSSETAPPNEEQAPTQEQPEEDDAGTEAASPIEPHKRYLLQFDGGSRGNPGVAGAGMVIYDDKQQEVWCGWKFLEHRATNNDAEYTALIVGLKCAFSLGITDLRVEGDSELIVRQLEGRYQVKVGRLRELWHEAKEIIPKFDNIEIRHIPRAQNKRADELANMAMDSRESFGFEDAA